MAEPKAEFYVYEHWRPDTGACFYVGKGKRQRCFDKDRNFFHKRVAHTLKKAGLAIDVRIVSSQMTEAEAFSLERDRIAHWRSIGVDLCNQTEGGEGSAYFSPDAIAKIKAARARQVITEDQRQKHRDRMADPATRAKLCAAAKERARTSPNPFAGRRHSEETKSVLSKKNKGKVLSKEHRAKISAGLLINNGFKGKKHSQDTKRLICEAAKRRDNSKFNFTGRKHSPETKAKMSEAAKRRAGGQ